MSLPPAQPAYILRGHAAAIHSASFMHSNRRLVTGDADGWIVVWSLETKRPVAVWRAHEGAILGARSWGPEKLITHGKDNKLIVWNFREEDEATMSVVLPVDTPPEPRKQPWLLHVLHVNTMNFCSFAHCTIQKPPSEDSATTDELLIAVPNTMSSETVDIFHLPSEERIHTVPGDPSIKGGMVMAISLFPHPSNQHLTVIAGYESGHTSVSQLSSASQTWHVLYTAQPHSQPILSLDVSPCKDSYLTSSADAIIAQHPIPDVSADDDQVVMRKAKEGTPLKTLQTKHARQQGLRVRNDAKIFATAGWDSKVRVYALKSLKELAVLKWHKDGCYAVAFADVDGAGGTSAEKEEEEGALVKRGGGALTVKEERMRRAKRTHWLVAGSKDGKVSLWDIY